MRSASVFASVLCVVCLTSAQAIAQDSGAAPPTPAPPAAAELPPVEVIQKKAQPATKAAQKKSAPKKKQVVAPAPQPAPVEPVQPVEATIPGTGGIDSGTVQMSPTPGSDIPIGKFPAGVGRANADDIARSSDASLPEVLQNTVPGVILGDAQGNVFQRNLQYRGFEASPVNGVAQGLAVYQNGVRINESFGDIVNWDFLPDNAIAGITITGRQSRVRPQRHRRRGRHRHARRLQLPGCRDRQRASVRSGASRARVAAGARSGNWGAFVAGEGIEDDGFRDFSEAEIKRMYADIGVKGDGVELHLNFTGADNHVGVTAAAPEQLLDLGWNRTFTSPQTTDNRMAMLSMNGSVKATSTLTFSGVGYYRWFNQKHDDGNIAEAEECDPPAGSGIVCFENEEDPLAPPEEASSEWPAHRPFDDDVSYGTIDRTSQNADGYGAVGSGGRQVAAVRVREPVPRRRQLRSWPRRLHGQQRARLLRSEVRRQQLRSRHFRSTGRTTSCRAT